MQNVCLCVLLAMLCVVVYGQESPKPSDVKEKVPVVKGSAPDFFTFIDDEGKPTHVKKVRLVEGSGPDLSALSNEERKPTPSRKLPVLKRSAPDLPTFSNEKGNPTPVRNVRLVERGRIELSKNITDSKGTDILQDVLINPVSSFTNIISKVTPRPSVDARSQRIKENASELFTSSDAEGDPTRSRRAAAVGDYQNLTNYFDESSGTDSSRTVDCKYLKSLMLRVAGGALSYFQEVFSNKGDDGVKRGIIPLPVSAIFGSPYLQGIEMKDLLPKIANSVAQFIGVQDPFIESRHYRRSY